MVASLGWWQYRGYHIAGLIVARQVRQAARACHALYSSLSDLPTGCVPEGQWKLAGDFSQNNLTRMLGGGGDHARLRQVLLMPVAIYGGYFGAGAGVIILSALSATSHMELRSLNALKNLFAFLMNASAIVFFIWFGLIDWQHTLVMMIGTLAGGFAGIKLTKVLPPSSVRFVIIACGVLMTAIYAYRYWL